MHRTVKREHVETVTNQDTCSVIAGAQEVVLRAPDPASNAEEAADSRNSELRAPDNRDESTRLLTTPRMMRTHRWWPP